MDIQDQHVNDLSKFFSGENICVETIKETSVVNSYDADDKYLKNTTAHTLRSLLSSRLGTSAFFFISGRQKNVPNGNGYNGDISCTREIFDFNSTCSVVKSDSTSSDDHSFFGSPLKLNTIANLSIKTSHTSTPVIDVLKKLNRFASPIPLCDARKILLRFSQINIQGAVNMMVVFCDGTDYNKTVILGGRIENTCDGKALTTFRVTADKVQLSDLERPLEKSEQGYHLTAQYKIMDKVEGLGSLIVEARWSDPLGRMKLIELYSAEFLLHIDVTPGCDQSPVFNYYCQLQKVQVLLEGLKTGELPEVLSQKTQKAVIELKELLCRIKDGETGALNIFTSEDSKRTAVAGMLCGTARHLNLEPTTDSDFTDMLWKILTNCTSFDDLLQCFNAVFCALRKGDLKVFIHKANQTTVAKLVRQSNCGMASFPSLNGHLPLRLATEIGIEKIRKDYHAMFISNGLCTSWQWDSFFQALTPVQDEIMDMEELNIQTLETQFHILSRLHHCLEIVSVVDSFTENQDLRSIANHVMNHYMSVKLARPPSFTVPITVSKASLEIKKHFLSSIKRESTGTGDCAVISLVSELPDELALPSLSNLIKNTDTSSFRDSQEFFMFRSQEHSLRFD